MLSWNCAADGRAPASCSRKTTVGMQSHSTCSHGSSRPSSLTLPRGTIARTSRHILHQTSFGHRPLAAPSLLLHGASTARRTVKHSPRRASKATLACVRASTASSTAEPTSTPTSSSLSRTLVTAPFATPVRGAVHSQLTESHATVRRLCTRHALSQADHRTHQLHIVAPTAHAPHQVRGALEPPEQEAPHCHPTGRVRGSGGGSSGSSGSVRNLN